MKLFRIKILDQVMKRIILWINMTVIARASRPRNKKSQLVQATQYTKLQALVQVKAIEWKRYKLNSAVASQRHQALNQTNCKVEHS